MFALLCKPVVVPTQTGNPVLRANDCRIAYVKPSQTQEGKLVFCYAMLLILTATLVFLSAVLEFFMLC